MCVCMCVAGGGGGGGDWGVSVGGRREAEEKKTLGKILGFIANTNP